ncbi:MBL fold metallo-hydrolase RNA specificity domain-containing protein [Sphingomonas arenae]|uniref:MBL fold metallo-hydrolase RNA specificity domain-containing protein n=1 Tax=Sphingomonas arenae TaxID=2812555 RepID=UPI001967AFD5|nr:MBL fold metallo-hydrolase RNA specificity domain-containing protein [Sphingomonas arenae]
MVDVPTLTFHGAAQTVTGSCYELRIGSSRILIDCGLFQGPRSLEALNREPLGFDPRAADALILTHAHIDHSGLLPRLAAEGFRGPIICTRATADLLGHMLPDAGRIQEYEAERRNRRPDRRDEEPIEPLYTEADALRACELIEVVDLKHWFEPATGIRARLWNAGHILGSASAEIEAGGSRLLFSGDLGPDNKAFHADPDAPRGLDHLLCESTYGDREREDVPIDQRRGLLKAEIERALAKGGNLVIPTFALERTQELLLDIATLINRGEVARPQVFIDSPLASRITHVFASHARELEDLGGTDVFRHPAFHFVETVEQSIRLNAMSGAIIMAASGMCEAGRIRHHLVNNLPRRDSSVLFVGFQAAGTLGRQILDGASRVRISGREVAVRAEVRRIDSYSAHADRSELLRWIAGRQPIAGSVFLTHGEEPAMRSLEKSLTKGRPATSVILPEIGELWELPPGSAARRLATGRTDLREMLSRDWQNDYADFSVQLKRKLRNIEDAGRRREALARMRAMLDEYERMRKV